MNSPNFKTVKLFTRITLFCVTFFVHVGVKAWDVDFSRREKQLKSLRRPANVVDEKNAGDESPLTNFFQAMDPSQEIVIMQTEQGFVPETVRLKKGQNYKVHIVNINSKQKNASFMLESFSENHATYFGEQKSFSISPKTEGIFSFQCPETSKQGRIIVIPDGERQPASH